MNNIKKYLIKLIIDQVINSSEVRESYTFNLQGSSYKKS